MKIIKEYATKNCICVLRSDCYGSSLMYFAKLLAVAQKDFPGLTLKEVEVRQYGGERYKYTFGIEFSRPEDIVPDSYSRIKQVEFTLSRGSK